MKRRSSVIPSGNLRAARLLKPADDRFERERLRLYRAYVTVLVRRASPFVVDLARFWHLDLGPALASMMPPRDWPSARPDAVQAHYLRPSGVGTPGSGRRRLPDRSVSGSDLLEEDGAGLLRLDLRGGCLEGRAWLGETMVVAADGRIQVWLPFNLPETLVTAAAGRLLAGIVDHPVFHRRRYSVSRAFADVGGRAVFEATARAVPFSVTVPEGPEEGSDAFDPDPVLDR